MRKAAFLLGALALVSSVAYAKEVVPAVEETVVVEEAAVKEQPKLVVTHVGQEIEIENEAGFVSYDQVNLFNNVGLKYEDWTFGLQAGKQWAIDLDGEGIHSSKHSSANRIQLDVWKQINDDLKLGFRFRGTKGYDRYYARWDWKHGMLWSAGDVWYEAVNEEVGGQTDWVKTEFFPIGVQYGPLKVGYFINYNFTVGSDSDKQNDEYIEHQIRAYATLYQGEKLKVTTEGRFTLAAEENYKGKKPHRAYDDFGRNRIYLGASYQVNENLSVYGNYGYEFRDWKYEDGTERDYLNNKDNHTKENYQDIILGWKYTF